MIELNDLLLFLSLPLFVRVTKERRIHCRGCSLIPIALVQTLAYFDGARLLFSFQFTFSFWFVVMEKSKGHTLLAVLRYL